MNIKLKLIIFVSLLVAVIVGIYDYIFYLRDCYTYDIDDAWEVYVNDEYIGTSDNDDVVTDLNLSVNKGSILTMQTVLPDVSRELYHPAIILKSRYCAYLVYLDDVLIESYEIDKYENDKYIGDNRNIISLPKEWRGKTLKIVAYPAEDDLSSIILDTKLGDYVDLERDIFHKYANVVVMGAFLIVFGLLFMIISVVFVLILKIKEMLLHAYASILLILSGILIHTYYCVNFLFMSGEHGAVLYYVCLYLSVSVCFVIARKSAKAMGKWYYMVEIFCDVTIALFILLHFAGILHINKSYNMFMITPVLCFVTVVCNYIELTRRKKNTEYIKIQYAGLLLYGTFMIFAMFLLNAYNNHLLGHGIFVERLCDNILIFGPMLYAFCQLYNYFVNITNSFSKVAEYNSLQRVAYEDALTELPNRAFMDKKLNEYEKSGNDYCIISIDINGLKDVNDKFGHAAGDKLISGFAKELKSVFEDVGTPARIGGDEFMVVLGNDKVKEIRRLLTDLDLILEYKNTVNEDPWDYYAAAGFAFRKETESLHETYLLADKRMYENKRRMKREIEENENDNQFNFDAFLESEDNN